MAEMRSDKEWQDMINDLVPIITRREDTEFQSYGVPSVPADLAKYIDHTLLKLDATPGQIDKLCDEAKEFKFKSVCVRLPFVSRCLQNLKGTDVVVACVVGFHEGNYATAEKVQEALSAVKDGAAELDMVINYDYIRSKSYTAAFFDVQAVRNAAPKPTVLKVILETSQLSREEIVAASVVAHAADADFIKTSTGFNGRGASLDDVRLMKAVVKDAGKVKASGGVRSKEDAFNVIKAGADRIGASSGVAIIQGMTSTASY